MARASAAFGRCLSITAGRTSPWFIDVGSKPRRELALPAGTVARFEWELFTGAATIASAKPLQPKKALATFPARNGTVCSHCGLQGRSTELLAILGRSMAIWRAEKQADDVPPVDLSGRSGRSWNPTFRPHISVRRRGFWHRRLDRANIPRSGNGGLTKSRCWPPPWRQAIPRGPGQFDVAERWREARWLLSG